MKDNFDKDPKTTSELDDQAQPEVVKAAAKEIREDPNKKTPEDEKIDELAREQTTEQAYEIKK